MTLAEAVKEYAREFEKRLAILEEYRDVERRLRNANRYVDDALIKVRMAEQKRTRQRMAKASHGGGK